MKIEGQLNNLLEGQFSLGIYTVEGEDEDGYFKAIIMGFIFFEILIIKYE